MPIEPDHLILDAETAERCGDWEEAKALWRTVLDGADLPDEVSEKAFLGLATAETKLGRIQDALQVVDIALSHRPSSLDLKDLKAEILMNARDWPAAEAALQDCFDQAAGTAKIKWFLQRSRALVSQNRLKEALASLEPALSQFHKNALLPLKAAELNLKLGAIEEAETLAKRAVKSAENDNQQNRMAEAKLLLSWVQFQLGRTQEADELIEAAKQCVTEQAEQRFRSRYVAMLHQTRQVEKLKCEVTQGHLSHGHTAQDWKAVFALAQFNEISAARDHYAKCFDACAEAGQYHFLIKNAGVVFDDENRKFWFRAIHDHATNKQKKARGRERRFLDRVRLRTLYGLEDFDSFASLAEGIVDDDTDEGQTLRKVAQNWMGCGQSRPKIFGIGLSKTGTSSLGKALEKLGYTVADFTNPISVELIRERDAHGFDALTDIPVAFRFENLYEQYPDAFFIFTERPLKSWVVSFERYFSHRLGFASFEELDAVLDGPDPVKFGRLYRDIFKHLYARHGSPAEAYKAHEKNVLNFFQGRPEARFFRFNVFEGHGFAELCEFLGVEVPEQNFPHENSSAIPS